MFLQEKRNTLCEEFDSQKFVLALAYLADIFSHLNDLNILIQEPNKTILDAGENLKLFLEKLPLWMNRSETTTLPTLHGWKKSCHTKG